MSQQQTEITEGVVVRPGDTLVVSLSPDVSVPEAMAMRDELKERLSGVNVLVLSGVEHIAAIRRTTDQGDTP